MDLALSMDVSYGFRNLRDLNNNGQRHDHSQRYEHTMSSLSMGLRSAKSRILPALNHGIATTGIGSDDDVSDQVGQIFG
jgi:hypothetical protein